MKSSEALEEKMKKSDVKALSLAKLIELDDKSHDRSDRRERDDFVDEAFRAAGLEVVHVRTQASYVLTEIRGMFRDKLVAVPLAQSSQRAANGVPDCPNCRIPMVKRTASKGSNKGNTFWGCPNYPNCRYVHSTD